jgi:hypothetical protein
LPFNLRIKHKRIVPRKSRKCKPLLRNYPLRISKLADYTPSAARPLAIQLAPFSIAKSAHRGSKMPADLPEYGLEPVSRQTKPEWRAGIR